MSALMYLKVESSIKNSMKNIFLVFWASAVCLCSISCSKKIMLQGAERLEVRDSDLSQDAIRVQCFYAGDAFEYIVFELDLFNESEYDVIVNARDISLIIHEPGNQRSLRPLRKSEIISQLEYEHRQVNAERKANNILGAIGIGVTLVAIGVNSNYPVIDGFSYAMESAVYMLEDNRAYALIEGSLEEQVDYVNQWVLERDTLAAGEDYSWDILFDRELINAAVQFVVSINGQEYIQDFQFYTHEERIR